MSPRHRQASEKKLAALAKARAALVKKHTCECCGCEDPAHGLQKHSEYRIYDTPRDGVMHRYCISCRLYFRWIETRQQIEQELHTLFAEHTPFYLIDLETTGKLEERHCQVVEIAVVNQDGQLVYHSFCKPDIAMPGSATEVSSITDAQLADAPPFTQIWPSLLNVLTLTEIPVYAWNADFDRQALLLTAKRFQLPVPTAVSDKTRWRCAMRLHARWYGEWSNGKNDYRWQPLEWACTALEIEGSEHHRAVSDAQNTLHVLQAIGSRSGKYAPPADMPHHERYYYGE
jgi:DNA polymerase III subunit epsilon